MKKIIAAAVAGAFIAPAFAANENFTLSGDFEYRYRSGNVSATTDTQVFNGGDQVIVFEGSTETENGLQISAETNLLIANDYATDTDSGTKIAISGGFGTLQLGDVASALDNVGDYSDVSPVEGGFADDGDDSNILFVAPTMVEGLKVSVSMAPEADGETNYAEAEESSSWSVAYGFSGGEVYYGARDFDTSADLTAFGVKASFGGLMVAAEAGKSDNGTVERDSTGLAVTYKIGDTTLSVENQVVENAAATDETDETIYAVKQSIGGGLSVYLESASIDNVAGTDDQDVASLGVLYAF